MTNLTLDEFITIHNKSNNIFPKSEWIKHPHFDLYVRASFRIFNRQITQIKDTTLDKTFNIANITAKNPGQGHFKQLLTYLNDRLSQTTFKFIYIENVLERRFAIFLKTKCEFEYFIAPYGPDLYPKSFYKEIAK